MKERTGPAGKKGGGAARADASNEDYAAAMNAALRLLSFRPRAEKELAQRLRDKGFGAGTAGRVLARLKELRYLDDRQFAIAWIRSRRNARCCGERVLKRQLLQKGVSARVADETLAEQLDREAMFSEACALVRRRIGKPGEGRGVKLSSRLQNLLLRRGFDYDFIREVLSETLPGVARGEGDSPVEGV